MSKAGQIRGQDATYRDDDRLQVHSDSSSGQRIIYLRHGEHHSSQQVVVAATSCSSYWSTDCFAPFIGRGALSLTFESSVNSTDVSPEDGMTRRAYSLDGLTIPKADLYCIGVDEVADSSDGDLWTSESPRHESNGENHWQPPALGLQFGDDQESKLHRTRRLPTEGGGAPLLIKICGALAGMGYDLASVAQVGGLVKKNLMTINSLALEEVESETVAQWMPGGHNTLELPEDGVVDHEQDPRVISQMLTEMLHPPSRRNNWVNINSNEPVLLVSNLGRLRTDDLSVVTSTIVSQLQKDWNIWPVRVYAGNFMKSESLGGFSVTILNVVNTDIGGPSMIQLLDEPCEAAGWNSAVHREVWNGRDLLLKEVHDAEAPADKKSLPHRGDPQRRAPSQCTPEAMARSSEKAQGGMREAPSEEEVAQTGDGRESIKVPAAKAVQGTEPGPEPLPETDGTMPELTQVVKPDRQEDVEPAPVEYPDPYAGRPEVRHPTWQRDHDDESLLDLVRKQSEQLSLIPEEDVKSGNDYAAIHSVPADLSGEEDYEVV